MEPYSNYKATKTEPSTPRVVIPSPKALTLAPKTLSPKPKSQTPTLNPKSSCLTG